MTYPAVTDERATLDMIRSGRSIARFGDGEFTVAEGRSIINQPRGDLSLSKRLREILHGQTDCLVGIPNIRSQTPKAHFWAKYLDRGAAMLDPSVPYVSSFITRPDSAPWINTSAYWKGLVSLWAGKDVTLVRGDGPAPHPKRPGRFTGGVSLLGRELTEAKSVTEVIGPSVDAWAKYDALLEEIGTPKIALICLGVTATVMASDLCAKGVHAIDLGHVGMFLRRYREARVA